jgi:tetratricopeptide (TPR) repeat protein
LYLRERNAVVFLILFLLLATAGCVTATGKLRWAERLYQEGQFLVTRGKQEAAVKKFEKSLALSREIDFQAGVAHNLNELAIYYTARQEYEQARVLLREAIAIYRQKEMAPEVSKATNNMALTYMREGRIQKALEQYDELLVWDQRTHNRLGEAITFYNTGKIYEEYLADHTEARRRYTVALRYFQQLNNEEFAATVAESLARLNANQ